ncbi:MAG: ribosome maturation factor RimP [Candidatus Omnitrophica bacterium]|nr:ribosome maturation factor RimP [Candidatus Omnitrophota bacterium]
MYVEIDKIKEIIMPLLENYGIDLVDLHFHKGRKKITLKFLVDKPCGGISLDDCAKLNEDIGDLLDQQGIIQESFLLEVSSPGLDRPLSTIKDFTRAKNKEVRFFLREPIKGKLELAGKIIDVKENNILIDSGNGEIEVPIEKINKAKQIF